MNLIKPGRRTRRSLAFTAKAVRSYRKRLAKFGITDAVRARNRKSRMRSHKAARTKNW